MKQIVFYHANCMDGTAALKTTVGIQFTAFMLDPDPVRYPTMLEKVHVLLTHVCLIKDLRFFNNGISK